MEKILDIVDALAHQKGLEPDSVRAVVKDAYINTAKRILGEEFEFDAQMDKELKNYRLYRKVVVVADNDERLASEKGGVIAVGKAKEIEPQVEVGDELKEEITLDVFGRTAAMTLYNELEKALQKLSEDAVYESYKSKVGKLFSGVVARVDNDENTYIEMGEVQAVLPKRNRIKGERFSTNETVLTVVKRVTMNMREGIKIELSRTTPKFLEELLTLEVPEIADGYISIEKAARIPGERAKVALLSHAPHIDPVGATVGTKGVRINAVSSELKNESIDVINYSPIPEIFISRAMSPAIVQSVVCTDDQKATVTITKDQKAKAIGRSGVNIRLASMLTGYEIALDVLDEETPSNESVKEEEKEEKSGLDALSALFT